MDTLALVSTAVLGIATFVLQDRVAKNAEAAAKELEHARVETKSVSCEDFKNIYIWYPDQDQSRVFWRSSKSSAFFTL
jgi:hypothetical protein